MTVEPTSEALELVRATRGYLEQLRDTGIDDVSVTDVATLTRALEGRLQSKGPKARPAQ